MNEAPTGATFSSLTVDENSASGTLVGIASGSDPDVAQTLTYAFTPGQNGGGRFTINALTGEIRVASGAVLDAETQPSHGVTVRVTDQNGLFIDVGTTITLNDLDEAPVIVSNGGGATASVSTPENTSSVTTVTAIDPEGHVRTYSIVGGSDAALFSINAATGALAFLAPPDREAPADSNGDNIYEITVRASASGGFDEQTISVTVTNVNEAPIIASNGGASAGINVNENVTAVTTVVATDPEGDARTYSIVGGADATAFTINPTTGVLNFIAPPNFEAPRMRMAMASSRWWFAQPRSAAAMIRP